jgi:hypothetical protein
MSHLAGDPHRDEREELQVAVPQRLEEPGPHGSSSRAAEHQLPDATRPGNKNNRPPDSPKDRRIMDHLGSAGRKRPAKNSSAEYLTMGWRSSRCEEITRSVSCGLPRSGFGEAGCGAWEQRAGNSAHLGGVEEELKEVAAPE